LTVSVKLIVQLMKMQTLTDLRQAINTNFGQHMSLPLNNVKQRFFPSNNAIKKGQERSKL